MPAPCCLQGNRRQQNRRGSEMLPEKGFRYHYSISDTPLQGRIFAPKKGERKGENECTEKQLHVKKDRKDHRPLLCERMESGRKAVGHRPDAKHREAGKAGRNRPAAGGSGREKYAACGKTACGKTAASKSAGGTTTIGRRQTLRQAGHTGRDPAL